MDLDLLPDVEQKALLAKEQPQEVTYSVIEFKGYYVRIAFFAGLGELFSVRSNRTEETGQRWSGVVVASDKTENVSLILLEGAIDPEQQPFVATRLDTEFFRSELA